MVCSVGVAARDGEPSEMMGVTSEIQMRYCKRWKNCSHVFDRVYESYCLASIGEENYTVYVYECSYYVRRI